ncbi:MAG: hypothetical protein H0V44_15775 [Planctomycetes bacterium]|nr:hypothetical protein [Planctomycetota bacterium]
MSPCRLTLLLLALMVIPGCDHGVPGGGPLVHSTALPSVQGSYTGTTTATIGGGVTFTVVGASVTGNIDFTFANSVSTPPATFTASSSFSGTYDPATRTVDFFTTDFSFDTTTGASSQNDYTGVITINTDRTFTVVLRLASDQHWNPGGGFVDYVFRFVIAYSGTRNPGS